MKAVVVGLTMYTRTAPAESFVAAQVRFEPYPEYPAMVAVPLSLGETLRLGSVLEITVSVVNT